VNRGEHAGPDGWVQPAAVLLIDGACRRLPEPERTERAREWIAEVYAILDDGGLVRWRRSVRALRFAAGQYRTVGRAAPRSAAVSRLDRSKHSEGDLGVAALGSTLAAAVFGGGIGYATNTHSLAVDAAVLLGTTLLSLALLVATVLVAVRRSSRRAGRGACERLGRADAGH
jgi:hypothetical protein